MPLRLIFMGTPDFAVPTLTEIIGQGHEVVVPVGAPDLRRHWHTGCWRREARRRGR